MRTAVVTVGSISESLALGGRVAGVDEMSLALTAGTRVQTVGARLGQTVEEGTVLVEADSREIVNQLTAARSRLETSLVKLTQEQARSEKDRQEAGRRTALDQARGERSLLEADTALRRAIEDLERVKAGPTPAERIAAEAAVTTASATLERAQADLTRLTRMDNSSELQAAEQEVTSTRLALQRSEAELARLRAGADTQDVRGAERELLTAQAGVEAAQAELDRLTRGADPQAVRSTEREVERAQNAIRDAQLLRPADAASRLARESAIRSAQVDLQEAQDRLAAVKAGPPAVEVDVARSKVQSARLAVDAARERLERIRRGPDATSVDTAALAVEQARGALQGAQARVAALRAGPADHQVSAALAAVDSATSNVESARAKLDDLNQQPRPADTRAAEDRVTLARAALARAQLEASSSGAASDSDVYTLFLLQKGIDEERVQVESLERDLAATRLRASFTGVVTAVYVAAGDSIVSGRPAIALAKPGDTVVKVPLSERELAVIAVGQDAAIKVDVDSEPVSGFVEQIGDNESGGGKIATVRVAWPDVPPPYGTPVDASITQSSKENTLIVPERAIRSNGARRYVEFMDGTRRRVADVQLGISGGGNVEVLRGLVEGQILLLRP